MSIATTEWDEVLEHLRSLVRGDGADLRLIGVDDGARILELGLDITDVECADCLLPPGRLQDVLSASLTTRGVTTHRLVLNDPRASTASRGADRITVLDPTAHLDDSVDDPGPDAGPLAGRTIGFRVDVLWPSWDWVVDEWTAHLAASGAPARVFRRVQGLSGDEGSEAEVGYQRFLSGIDVAIVGLGNCGSCTSWTVKDAVKAADAGLPTVAVVTGQFTSLASTLARHYGRSGLRTFSLPFPLQTRPEHEVRAIARDAFAPLLALLGATR